MKVRGADAAVGTDQLGDTFSLAERRAQLCLQRTAHPRQVGRKVAQLLTAFALRVKVAQGDRQANAHQRQADRQQAV